MPSQAVSVANIDIRPGETAQIPVIYRVTDRNVLLAGIGGIILFDPNQLEFIGYTPSFSVDLFLKPETAYEETALYESLNAAGKSVNADLDGNSKTTKGIPFSYVTGSEATFDNNPATVWDGSLQWPNNNAATSSEGLKLFDLQFRAKQGFTGSPLNIVITTTSPGYSAQSVDGEARRIVGNAPGAIRLSNSTLNEGDISGAVVGNLSSVDADSADTFSYTLTSGTGSEDNEFFSINKYNQLAARTSLDREKKASYRVRIRSTDSTGLSTEEAFTVNLNNLQDPIKTREIDTIELDGPNSSKSIELSTHFDDPFSTGQVARFTLSPGLQATIANTFGGSLPELRTKTSIDVLLFDQSGAGAPLSTANLAQYVNAGRYKDTIVHRLVPGFVLQGGGFAWSDSSTGGPSAITSFAALQNEFSGARSNIRGTVAMAKLGGDPNSATSQWFFNLGDNTANLDNQNGGFTVIGRAKSPLDLLLMDILSVSDTPLASNATYQGNVFQNLPVVGLTSTSTTITPANALRFSAITLEKQEELSYAIVTNSHPEALEATLSGSQLNLKRLDNTDKGITAQITIEARNAIGEAYSQNIAVALGKRNNGPAMFSLNGTGVMEEILTATKIADDPDGNGTPSYQWQALLNESQWTELGNGDQLKITRSNEGQKLRLQISYTDGKGFPEKIYLPEVLVPKTDDGDAGFSISGKSIIGQTLTAAQVSNDPDGNGSFSYQWQSSVDGKTWETIATTKEILLAGTNSGQQVRLQVAYSDAQGFQEVISTDPVKVLEPRKFKWQLSQFPLPTQKQKEEVIAYSIANGKKYTESWNNAKDYATKAAFALFQDDDASYDYYKRQVEIEKLKAEDLVNGLKNLLTYQIVDRIDNTKLVLSLEPWIPSFYTGVFESNFRFGYGSKQDDNDNLGKDWQDHTLYFEDGNDNIQITQGSGVKTIRIDLGSGDDSFTGADGFDFILGNLGTDTISGGPSTDVVYGGLGDDFLEGGDDDDLLGGGEGNDSLYGGRGDDLIDGGDGSDYAVFTRSLEYYSISQGPGSSLVIKNEQEDDEEIDLVTSVEHFRFNGKEVPLLKLLRIVSGNLNDTGDAIFAINGQGTIGETLSILKKADDPDGNDTFSCQWQVSSDGAIWIDTTNGDKQRVDRLSEGKTIRALISYKDFLDFQETIATPAINIAYVNEGSATFAINGFPKTGSTLTALKTYDDPDGNGVFSYQWQATASGGNWSNISEMDHILIDKSIEGEQIRLQINYKDGQGFVESTLIPSITIPFSEPGIKIISQSNMVTTENGGSATLSCRLQTQPTATVVLHIQLSQGAEASTSVSALSFTSSNWQTPQDIILTGKDDFDADGDKAYTIRITCSSEDGQYDTNDPLGVQALSVQLQNLDDGEDIGIDIYGDANSKAVKDNLQGTEGPDRIYGLLADDTVNGGPGKDELYGGYGNDLILGDLGDDELYGEQGNDTLRGGAGADRLTGGDGINLLIGGAGNDTYVIDDNRDTIDDQGLATDVDTVLFRANLASYSLPDSIRNARLDSGSAFRLIGNAKDNQLKGNDNSNELDGGSGNDSLNGGGGNDLLKGGDGQDTADYSVNAAGFLLDANGAEAINVNLLLGTSTGTQIGNDMLVGIEHVITADGADTLIGDGYANRLEAGGGADTITAQGGDDLLIGGAGDDQLSGGEGIDTAQFMGAFADYSLTSSSTPSGLAVILEDSTPFRDGHDILTGIELFQFTDQQLNLLELTARLNGTTVTTWSADLDGDGRFQPLQDGLFLMHHLEGQSLITGGESMAALISPAASRRSVISVHDYLDQGLSAKRLDVDGNQVFDSRDGHLLMRHSLGTFPGDALLAGLSNDPLPRGLSAIHAHLQGLMPHQTPVVG